MANDSTGTRPDLSPPPPPRPYSPATGSARSPLATARSYSGTPHRQQFALQRRIGAGLGWFGIGLGLFELAAPRALAQLIGLEAPSTRWRGARRMAATHLLPRTVRADPVHSTIIRGLGLREILSGIGILVRPRPTPWLWSRVIGDMMDLSLLGLALNSPRTDRTRLAGAAAAVAGVTALDLYASIEFARARRARLLPITMTRSLPLEATTLIHRPPQECYRFWHDFENLPRFMRSVESVRLDSDRRSHWVAKAPGGVRLEWDSEIIDDTPDRLISWRSVNADVPNAGSVRFDPAPGGRGTLVRVHMSHDMPTLSGFAARLIGKVPKRQVKEDLRRFKQIMESGEIATTRAGAAISGVALAETRHMKANCWYGAHELRVEARCDPQDHRDRDLRLGPAPVRGVHSGDDERRHPRPRVHGRGRRGTRRVWPRNSGATRRPGSSAIRIWSEATRAGSRMAETHSGAETLDYEQVDVPEALRDMTGGRGPDACIDAVGMEAHLPGVVGAYDRLKQALMLQTDRPSALRQAMMAVRNGGVLSIPGVLIHRLGLDEAAEGYRLFRDAQNECIKVVLKPWETPSRTGVAAPPRTRLH
jgi:uncharacterized membrane protein